MAIFSLDLLSLHGTLVTMILGNVLDQKKKKNRLPVFKFINLCLISGCIYTFVVVQSPSCVWLCDSMVWHTRPPCPSPSPGVCPSSCSLHQWCHPAISSSDTLFFLNLSQHQGVFQWVVCSHQMTKILELQLQHSATFIRLIVCK